MTPMTPMGKMGIMGVMGVVGAVWGSESYSSTSMVQYFSEGTVTLTVRPS